MKLDRNSKIDALLADPGRGSAAGMEPVEGFVESQINVTRPPISFDTLVAFWQSPVIPDFDPQSCVHASAPLVSRLPLTPDAVVY